MGFDERDLADILPACVLVSIMLGRHHPLSFDATRAFPHHSSGTSSGMKHTLLAAFLLCATLYPASADVVIPKPSQLIVSNLAAYPKVKFSISVGDRPIEPLKEDKTYEFMAATKLYAEDGNNRPRDWATLEYHGFNSEVVKILVKKVTYGKAGLEVGYDIDKTPLRAPPRRRPTPGTAAAWPPFVLAGFGCCGLVLLARRRDQRDEAS